MERRKIQLIAGTTYNISLPKEWVKKNNLKEKKEVLIYEKNDRTLVVSPTLLEGKKLTEISLNVDEYVNNIDQILFAVYYLGIETISLFSKKEITKETRAKIRKTLTHMSGTEINYEDQQKIIIKVLLDKSKVDISQILFRISLIIDSSISNLLEKLEINEIRINENEIDRLYHLVSQIVSSSLIDSSVLNSSNIKNVSLIPSYFLISKRLENIGDNINHLAEYLSKNKFDFEHKKEILSFIKSDLKRIINPVLSNFQKNLEEVNASNLNIINNHISNIKDKTISDYLSDIIRYLIDINEEIVIISFYNQLIRNNSL